MLTPEVNRGPSKQQEDQINLSSESIDRRTFAKFSLVNALQVTTVLAGAAFVARKGEEVYQSVDVLREARVEYANNNQPDKTDRLDKCEKDYTKRLAVFSLSSVVLGAGSYLLAHAELSRLESDKKNTWKQNILSTLFSKSKIDKIATTVAFGIAGVTISSAILVECAGIAHPSTTSNILKASLQLSALRVEIIAASIGVIVLQPILRRLLGIKPD